MEPFRVYSPVICSLYILADADVLNVINARLTDVSCHAYVGLCAVESFQKNQQAIVIPVSYKEAFV